MTPPPAESRPEGPGRRQTQDATVSEEWYRLLVESIPHPVWMARPDGLTSFLNQRGVEQIGMPAEVVHGWSWLDLLHPDDVERARSLWEACVRDGTPYRNEYRVRTPGGTHRWYLSQAVPVRRPDGAVERWVGTWTDIDALKRAEEVRSLRDRAIQAVTQGILITDPSLPDNPIVYASASFERMTGYPPGEVLGRNCRFLQGKDTDPAAVAQLREAIGEARPCTVELINYRKDGTPFWNELSISPVTDEGRRVTHFVGVQTDVTRRRRLEEQYRQSQKMEAVGQLAGGVAHDFNNLLTIITGYSELLLQSLPASDPARGLLEEIRKAGERSASLTRQLLAFSRKQVLAPRVLDLNEVVRDTEKMLRRVIGEDIQLVTVLHPRLGHVRADPGQLEQVLLNLAVNARDAMPQGGRLTIATGNVQAGAAGTGDMPAYRGGPCVMLEVTDTGEGMTEEVRRHIFEPFFTTKGSAKGTGLGLAVVHGIVQQSEGHIEVASEPGRGTTFTIYLPRVEHPARPGKISPSLAAAPRGTETVLLVEDDDAVRALARHVLRGCGYTVLDAGNGDEAQRVAVSHVQPIHLLVTDVVMPGVGGRLLAERLRLIHPEMKVLYLSGYTDDAVVRHGIMQEQVSFLQKPFVPAALAHKVREVLSG